MKCSNKNNRKNTGNCKLTINAFPYTTKLELDLKCEVMQGLKKRIGIVKQKNNQTKQTGRSNFTMMVSCKNNHNVIISDEFIVTRENTICESFTDNTKSIRNYLIKKTANDLWEDYKYLVGAANINYKTQKQI